MKISKWFIGGFAMLYVSVIPAIGYSQSPPPPGPGGNGGNPDSPLGVPFDTNMNIMFVLVAVVFAVIVLKRIQKERMSNLVN